MTQELTLQEILILDVQLNGLAGPGKKILIGIMDEELSIKAKYWLDKLRETIINEVERMNKFKNELIKKYGEKVGKSEQFEIRAKITKKNGKKEIEVENPKWEIYQKELTAFLEQKIEIEYKPIKFDLLADLKTKNDYSLVYKFVTEPIEEVIE